MITFNGLTADELLALPDEDVERSILSGGTVVVRVGSADVLGRFRVDGGSLVLELGHIDGGGEGVLPAIAALAQRYARRRGLAAIDWRVHAVRCPEPNVKLHRLMERRGFRVADVPGVGTCYAKREAVGPAVHESGR